MDFGERLRAKVGPLPVWVWGLIAGGAFTIWYWVSQRDAGTVPDESVGDGTEPGTVTPPSGDFGTVPVLPTTPDGVQDENTNQEWLIQALSAASEAGVSFVSAQTALSKYLAGEPLTKTEETIVNRVIGLVGPPPEGTFGIPEVTPDPEPTKPTTTNYDTVTTLSVPSTARYGSTIIIRVGVKWKSASGKSTPVPTAGRVRLKIGDKTYNVSLVGGQGVRPTRIVKTDKRLNGNRLVVSARFEPWSPTYKTKPSAAAPKVVTFK